MTVTLRKFLSVSLRTTILKSLLGKGSTVSLFERNTQAFILRIWLEPRAAEESGYEWRGVIEHLPTGERHYFLDLEEIPALIQPYLPFKPSSMRGKRNFKRWLKQWKFSSHRKRD